MNPVLRYRLLVFDFDGTLADSTVLFDQFIPAFARQRGVSEPPGGWHSLRGLDSRAMLRALRIRWWQLPAVTAQMRTLMTANLHQVRLYPGLPAVLQQLHRQGLQLRVVSSNSQQAVEQVLGPYVPLFAALHCGAPLLGKRRVMARALRQSGVAAGQALSIGDEVRDAEASHACGMDFVGVGWGLAPPAVLQPRSDWPVLQQPEDLLLRLQR